TGAAGAVGTGPGETAEGAGAGAGVGYGRATGWPDGPPGAVRRSGTGPGSPAGTVRRCTGGAVAEADGRTAAGPTADGVARTARGREPAVRGEAAADGGPPGYGCGRPGASLRGAG
ncbi:hypothetical protein KMT30_49070, partial [Streptomyces sp. IBSBF 2953]|nr:hypothetical protein [Streptomyces hayashii]